MLDSNADGDLFPRSDQARLYFPFLGQGGESFLAQEDMAQLDWRGSSPDRRPRMPGLTLRGGNFSKAPSPSCEAGGHAEACAPVGTVMVMMFS